MFREWSQLRWVCGDGFLVFGYSPPGMQCSRTHFRKRDWSLSERKSVGALVWVSSKSRILCDACFVFTMQSVVLYHITQTYNIFPFTRNVKFWGGSDHCLRILLIVIRFYGSRNKLLLAWKFK